MARRRGYRDLMVMLLVIGGVFVFMVAQQYWRRLAAG